MSYQLVVLAAGLGSRFGGAKQLERVGPGGETLMDYAIFDAAAAGVRRVVFVARREHQRVFREEIARRYEPRLEVTLAFQELDDLPAGFAVPPGRVKPWGTGHAVWAARRAVDGPFATINADDFYGPEGFARLRDFFAGGSFAAEARPASSPAQWALVTYELGNTLS
jgi:choline kinase